MKILNNMDRSPTRPVSGHNRRPSVAAETEDQLQLKGSQVNLVSRIQYGTARSPSGSIIRKSRPSSALPSYDDLMDHKSSYKRPMSADNDNLKRRLSSAFLTRSRSEKLSLEDDMDYEKFSEKVSNLRHSYTESSSRLLRSLLREPWNSEASETSSETSLSEKSLGRRIQEMAQSSCDEPSEKGENNGQDRLSLPDASHGDKDSDLTKCESNGFGGSQSTLCLQDLNEASKNNSTRGELSPGSCKKEEKRVEKEDKKNLDVKFQRWFPHSGKNDKLDEKSVRFLEQELHSQLESLSEDDSESDEGLLESPFQCRNENFTHVKPSKEISYLPMSDSNTERGGSDHEHRDDSVKNIRHRDCNKVTEGSYSRYDSECKKGNATEENLENYRNLRSLSIAMDDKVKHCMKPDETRENHGGLTHRLPTCECQTRSESDDKPQRDYGPLPTQRNEEAETVLIDLTEETPVTQIICPFSCCQDSTKQHSPGRMSSRSYSEVDRNSDLIGQDPVKLNQEFCHMINTNQVCQEPATSVVTPRGSTYGDIESILHVLEQEEAESLLVTEAVERVESTLDSGANEQLKDIYSYLEEVERCCDQVIIDSGKSRVEAVQSMTGSSLPSLSSVPRLEELLSSSTVELAHQVLSMRLQVEDQSSSIKLLQQTIAEMKESAKAVKADFEEQLLRTSTDAEAAVQRHQKFIKQLLNEKKSLNDKVSTLVEEIKSGEERYQRNLKAIEERHAIEIQRVKETQSAAEKLKREKWIDTKTQKIKEMTVKGLEPELSRMAARQQQEMTELRNLHRAELEAVELRATRRTTELLDQLRTDLAKDKEETIQRETSVLRAKLEKQMEEERSHLQHEAQKLREEIRREKERLATQELHMQDTMMEAKRSYEREKERERQRLIQEHQEKMEANQRRHQNELKSVKDTLEIEKEAWMNNYKKQQTTKFLEREAELHYQYKRERDREIELVIERLENEATQARLQLNQAAENKLRRLREKLEGELREVEASEAALKVKLSETKSQLTEKEDVIVELNSQLRHAHTEAAQLNKLCQEMSSERKNLKGIIRKEFENQLVESVKDLENLKNEICNLKTSHALELAKKDQYFIQAKAEAQKELNQVYSRVKLTVAKKDEALEVLREQHRAALERCSHLEQMLDSQRRNLLLK